MNSLSVFLFLVFTCLVEKCSGAGAAGWKPKWEEPDRSPIIFPQDGADCSGVRCAVPKCPGRGVFSRPVTSPGCCCPYCPLDCTTVRCANPECGPGEEPYYPPGSCCTNLCKPTNCAAAICPQVVCNDGSPPPVPEGSCCGDVNLCEDDCSQVRCLIGCKPGQVPRPGACCCG